MGHDPNKGREGSKIAEAIQVWVIFNVTIACVSFCSVGI